MNAPYSSLVIGGKIISECIDVDILGVKFGLKLTFNTFVRTMVSCISS